MHTFSAALLSTVLALSACSSLSGCSHSTKPPAAPVDVVQPVVSPDPVSSDDGMQGGPCGEGGKCGPGLTCREYYGFAGAMGPKFTSCEIPCIVGKTRCPEGQVCLTISDGPGSVCRPQDRILPPPVGNDR